MITQTTVLKAILRTVLTELHIRGVVGDREWLDMNECLDDWTHYKKINDKLSVFTKMLNMEVNMQEFHEHGVEAKK